MTSVPTYIRHRDRMVQESVYQDLKDTLIACRWMAGTTSHEVMPLDGGPRALVTTTPEQVLKLAGGHPVNLIDFFPESGGGTEEEEAAVDSDKNRTPPNTLAIDDGTAGQPEHLEVGSSLMEQPYAFALVFYGATDSVAKAVLTDLRDRYLGRIVEGDFIGLYDYNQEEPPLVCRMEVDGFRYTRNTETATPSDVHLFFGELAITDFVD